MARVGPYESNFLTLVLKTFAGLAGGVVGTVVLLVIFLLGASILQPTLVGGSTEFHPLFIFVFIAMVFLSSLAANIVGSLLFSLIQHDKYIRPTSAIYQIFFVNLVILAIMSPVYLLVFTLGLDLTAFLAGIHVMLASLSSVMILEIVGNLKYALLGVYSSIFSILFATGLIFIFYQFAGRSLVILIFITLPVIWTFLGFISVIVEMFYFWLYRLYGMDFLAATTSYGKEYGREEKEPDLPQDVAGSEFLRK